MVSPGKAQKQAARTARLSAALRENLKRRKAQTRGRSEDREAGGKPSPGAAPVEPQAPDFRRNRGRD
jgi:hypothetical protein